MSLNAHKRETPLAFSRSRLGNKNDNARVEQKNGSVVREYFGCNRLDNLALKKDLDRLCEQISFYNNPFRHSKRIISKTKKPNTHGCAPPRVLLERALETDLVLTKKEKRLRARLDKANSIRLLEDICRHLSLFLRKQCKKRAAAVRPEVPPRPSAPELRPATRNRARRLS